MNSFYAANILIPKNIDMTKWSVVACDQYTSEPDYWNAVSSLVGSAPSTLNLIYPEIYLSGNKEKRISDINRKMKEYIDMGLFHELENSMVFVKRSLKNGKIRSGLIGTIDLEDYDYKKGSSSNIRATEGTVMERIPPRVQIRENAPLEFPHIMILIDDPDMTVIEPLSDKVDSFGKLYDFNLMQNGGSICGYSISKEEIQRVTNAIETLSSKQVFEEKYGVKNKPVLTFAVGDGNHSLATAKTCWENIKASLSKEEQKTHPARFALIELVNLHDSSLEFEPIHRVIFGVNPEEVYKSIFEFYPQASETDNGGKKIICTYGSVTKPIWIKDEKNNLAAGTFQDFADDYLSSHSGTIDYIHGQNVVEELSRKENNIGFILPAMQKSDLFKTVILNGALPRKTFSMGEACDKRYYLEGKKIKKWM